MSEFIIGLFLAIIRFILIGFEQLVGEKIALACFRAVWTFFTSIIYGLGELLFLVAGSDKKHVKKQRPKFADEKYQVFLRGKRWKNRLR